MKCNAIEQKYCLVNVSRSIDQVLCVVRFNVSKRKTARTMDNFNLRKMICTKILQMKQIYVNVANIHAFEINYNLFLD